MKKPMLIPVSVALSDKEYHILDEIPVHCRQVPPPPLTCALQHFTDSLPAPIYTPKGGGGRKMSVTLWELSVFPKNATE